MPRAMRVAAGAVLALAGAPAPSHTHSQPEPESWLPSWQPSWGGDAARQWARRRLQDAPLACDTVASLGDRGLGLWGTDLNTLGDTLSSACKPHRRFAGGATNANGGNNTFVMAAANAGAYVHGAPITAALMDAAIADPSSFACDEDYVLDTEVTFQCCTAGGAASLSGQPCKVEVQEVRRPPALCPRPSTARFGGARSRPAEDSPALRPVVRGRGRLRLLRGLPECHLPAGQGLHAGGLPVRRHLLRLLAHLAERLRGSRGDVACEAARLPLRPKIWRRPNTGGQVLDRV